MAALCFALIALRLSKRGWGFNERFPELLLWRFWGICLQSAGAVSFWCLICWHNAGAVGKDDFDRRKFSWEGPGERDFAPVCMRAPSLPFWVFWCFDVWYSPCNRVEWRVEGRVGVLGDVPTKCGPCGVFGVWYACAMQVLWGEREWWIMLAKCRRCGVTWWFWSKGERDFGDFACSCVSACAFWIFWCLILPLQ